MTQRIVNSVPNPPRIVTHLSAPTVTLTNLIGPENNSTSTSTSDIDVWQEGEDLNDIPAIPGMGPASLKSKIKSKSSSRSVNSTSYNPHNRSPSPHSRVSPSAKQITGNGHLPGGGLHESPLLRQYPSRPLSPDLPYRDALYLFCNYSSYMQSPGEGAEGVKIEDFRDSVRLLEYARNLAAQPYNNVHVLHLKYRFEQPLDGHPFGAMGTNGSRQAHQSVTTGIHQPSSLDGASAPSDLSKKVKNPVPQPFSVLHDPVIKIDYRNDGIFEPLPAQAIFTHIAQKRLPPPRIIVISYVGSTATQNHLASLSTWARASSPPIYIFSPLETRIREKHDLSKALLHAIPISMYASPYGPITPSPRPFSPASRPANQLSKPPKLTRRRSHNDLEVSKTIEDLPGQSVSSFSARLTEPIASLTVITSPIQPIPQTLSSRRRISQASIKASQQASGPGSATLTASNSSRDHEHQIERIPLWALAPGVGVLHGSTSASIGVKLEDFSAAKLRGYPSLDINAGDKDSLDLAVKGRGGGVIKQVSKADLAGVKTASQLLGATGVSGNQLAKAALGVEDLLHRPASETESTSSRPITPVAFTAGGQGVQISQVMDRMQANEEQHPDGTRQQYGQHLTPPDRMPTNLFEPRSRDRSRHQEGSNELLSPGSSSWNTPRAKVGGWRKGRKEQMEDILDEMGIVSDEVSNDQAPVEQQEPREQKSGSNSQSRKELLMCIPIVPMA